MNRELVDGCADGDECPVRDRGRRTELDRVSGDLTGVVLTFSDRHTELSGTVKSSEGDPVTQCFVVVLPADRGLWHALRTNQRTLSEIKCSASGCDTTDFSNDWSLTGAN